MPTPPRRSGRRRQAGRATCGGRTGWSTPAGYGLQKTPKCASITPPVIVQQTPVCPRGYWWGVHATPAKEYVRVRPCHGAVLGTPGSAMLLKNARATGDLWHHRRYGFRALLDRHAMTAGAPRPDQALQLLGHTIRDLRKRQGLTQRALATRVGLTRTYVSAIEQGQRNVTIWTLLLIAAALQVPLSTLLQPLEDHPELYALPAQEHQ